MLNKNIQTFIACDSEYDDAKIVLFGAGYDSTTSFRPGTRFAPNAIRSESFGIETYSPYQDKDMTDHSYFDSGDLELPFGSVRRALADIAMRSDTILKDGKLPFMIGGEHLVTLGSVMAVKEKYDDLYIIHFDAHADLRDDYLGQPLSHACVLRRCHELVGDGHIFQFGIRSGEREEFEFAKEHTEMHKFNFDGLAETVEKLKGKNVYFTLDLDVLDPSVFCGTGTPEAEGVSFKELREAVTLVCSKLNIVGCDVNELSPHYDQSGASTAVACKIIREMLLALSHGEKMNENIFSDIPIEYLDFSVRTYNCLKRAGVNTLLDLIFMNGEELTKVRNLNKKSYDEIADRLNSFNINISNCELEEMKKKVKLIQEINNYVLQCVKKEKALNMSFEKAEFIEITDSKVGGIPYLPQNENPPCIENSNRQFRFLMQINCEQVKGFGDLPSHGIIQFWIDPCFRGYYLGDGCRYFRGIYYREIDTTVNCDDVIPKISQMTKNEIKRFPVKDTFKLRFNEVYEFEYDEFDKLFCERYNSITGEIIKSYRDLPSYLHERVWTVISRGRKSKNKIGGIPYFPFTNDTYDIRNDYEELRKYDYSLVELSDTEIEYRDKREIIMEWGSNCVCHFLINKEKLKAGDFSDIWYACPEEIWDYADCDLELDYTDYDL